MPEKHPVTCPACSYRWDTRVKDPLMVVCPKCEFKAWSETNKAPNPNLRSTRTYSITEVRLYIKYLGCWSSENFERAAALRTPQEYRAKLLNLIEVNKKTRPDQTGAMEIREAKEVLKRLGQ